MPPIRFDHFAMAVTKFEETTAFYQEVLGAQLIEHTPGRFAFRWSSNQIMVLGPDPVVHPTEPIVAGSIDMCFVWPGPLAGAQAHLAEHGVPVHAGPMDRTGAGGGGRSVYFRDPEGNLLEFISYP